MKAAIYSRFSTDRQNEASIADQVRVCTEYAQRAGFTVVAKFEDQGISGEALGNRPGVQQAIRDAKEHKYDVLIVMEMLRLARGEDLPPLVKRLKFHGLRMIGVQDGFDSDTPHARMQAGMSGIIGGEFIEMVRRRTYSALQMRAKDHRPTGGRAYGYIAASQNGGTFAIDESTAPIVREIFERYAAGESHLQIATDLNARKVPSPGSAWKRTTRRAAGWMGSAIRAMLRNPIYKGDAVWNTSEWRKDPDSGKRKRIVRPQSEWISHHNPALQIVSAELWGRAQRRTRSNNVQLKAGGKPRYVLSGLLRCDACDAHYVIADAVSYACSGYLNGRACSNSIRVRRDHVQAVLLGGLRDGLLAPAKIERLAKDIRQAMADRERQNATDAAQAPQAIREIDARLERLRERMRAGDPDMTNDDLHAAIERAEAKRRELMDAQPAAKAQANVQRLLPKAAEMARQWLKAALDGNAPVSPRARPMLRDFFGGQIRLVPEADGSLWADYQLYPAALLRAGGTGTCGSGGRI